MGLEEDLEDIARIQEQQPIALVVIDRNQRIKHYNPAFSNLMEMVNGDIMGNQLFSNSFEEIKELTRVLEEILASRDKRELTNVKYKKNDDSEIYLKISINPYEDGMGAVINLVDVTNEVVSGIRDTLTGAYNRRYLEDVYPKRIRELRRLRKGAEGGSIGIVFADLKEFKKVNDTFGHNIGDDMLRHAARAIQQALYRPLDELIRYGGDEFIVLMPDADNGACETVVKRIVSNVEEYNRGVKEEGLKLKLNIGCSAAVNPSQDYKELVAAADRRMYADKGVFINPNP